MKRPQDAHEDTPLLADRGDDAPQESSKPPPTPLPWRQLSIVLLLQVVEPLTAQVIVPFLPQMILDIGVTHGDESQVGYYVGLVHTLFYVAQTCTVFYWSHVSDQIGRKPVVLIGLAGLAVSMYCFGLSRTFWGIILSRCLRGVLNGNSVLIKSMVAEISDSTNIARAYSFIPITWFLGASIGPLIGGLLEHPAEKFPAVFGGSTFLKEYPYFLPCFISAIIAAVCWLIFAVFFKETANVQMSPKEYFIRRWRRSQSSLTDSPAATENGVVIDDRETPLSFRELLIAPVLVATGSYASFTILDISFRTVLPVYLATPLEMGGLGLDPPAIGTILATMEVAGGVLQLLLFAPLHSCLGGKAIFLTTMSLFFPIAALFPITNRMAQEHGLNGFVWFLVGLQIFLFACASLAICVTYIYINAAAPNRASVGATIGLAQLLVSIMSAVGPSAINSAFALGIQKHVMGGYFAYWVMAGMATVAVAIGVALPKGASDA
ncbi:hypothetical protein SCLCIDRAFT_1223128 [Scleroderma citrinum Foug A]|uniref:Major facilitator superfamily (MFS) profile domain-containing protein n=1 Tax=Scleroderma citrinum Foug A TaxID=1036808 RepID=A0A0C2YU01_9AGAM|nr:hypothetical protein SCLCIDRAFT_1223128 [Scleroderma citrinum Foug A]